ncbi:nitroreductase family deazaflavin-dependent oxidoreductase [Nocardia uniformis]|uniref:Nitroreductase family deazaflavin-dependent oxidoreductase n=1 Tax=Nocardia uniformis TaxID=53432 RepID=A0A849CAQ4_9NOCA|nr:nitroreductase family deazaflavin-dependent oxidoreductase [Nocardia uniformis]NNH75923.1 nitroreductase family deazaflavin-dependent oxidoreductase [Nocardia uniformis]
MNNEIDSPDRSVADHVRRYLATDGADGYLEGGVTNLVITTVGRKTGKPRRTALFYGEHEGRYILVASGSTIGNGTRPGWYRNLLDNPQAQVQIRADRFTARARVAQGREREQLWHFMTERFPPYLRYQAAVEDEIPIVVLERTE